MHHKPVWHRHVTVSYTPYFKSHHFIHLFADAAGLNLSIWHSYLQRSPLFHSKIGLNCKSGKYLTLLNNDYLRQLVMLTDLVKPQLYLKIMSTLP